MSWIKYAVAGLVLCAGASVASAQSGPPAGAPPMGGAQGQQGGRGRGMQALLEGVDLTDAQKAKLDEIRGKYRAQMQALRQGGGADAGAPDPAAREKMDELQEHQQHDIREILTDDQRKIFDVNVAEMKKRREEMKKR